MAASKRERRAARETAAAADRQSWAGIMEWMGAPEAAAHEQRMARHHGRIAREARR